MRAARNDGLRMCIRRRACVAAASGHGRPEQVLHIPGPGPGCRAWSPGGVAVRHNGPGQFRPGSEGWHGPVKKISFLHLFFWAALLMGRIVLG